ncbi:hypothetical protein VQ643_05955 [Pseudomonas sp. F1_0610]|uniref:COG3650 family protein n=1 Tax=Pseudomonas sp. F1_0610 TaxID=3114284 RepID=UPI0039C213EE
MHLLKLASLSLGLPLLTACSLFSSTAENNPLLNTQRLQGTLNKNIDNSWTLITCDKKQLKLTAHNEYLENLNTLEANGSFVDIAGQLEGHSFTPVKVYRTQREGFACDDARFKRLILRAMGNEPAWIATIENNGFLLQRLGEPAQAVPYIEEQLPNGNINISATIDGQPLQLWLTEQHCNDSMADNQYHLTAELRIGQNIERGCAYFGLQHQ